MADLLDAEYYLENECVCVATANRNVMSTTSYIDF